MAELALVVRLRPMPLRIKSGQNSTAGTPIGALHGGGKLGFHLTTPMCALQETSAAAKAGS
jgi:hypothetical protein